MMLGCKKLLFVAYTFPPIPYGGTYRAQRLCRGLVAEGVECHVVTIKEYPDIPNDYDLLAKVPDSVHIYRTPTIDPWRRFQVLKKKYLGKFWFQPVNKLVSLLLRALTFPDHMLLWVPFAIVKAYQVIKRQNIDTVLVSSPPHSSQLVGWILKKLCKVRWVADFRDPIYFGNVAQVNMIDSTGVLERFEKKMLAKFDRFIACNADTLVANTETHAGQLQRNFGCKNIHVVRNSFDPADFSGVDKSGSNEFTIAHIGSIYGKRNPGLLFAAISQLANEYAPEKLNLRVIFLGLGGHSLEVSIEKFNIQEYVTVFGQVPHKKAISCMCSSHLLLLLKATGRWSQGQIPGKFYEYIGSRNPVLCIGPQESEVAKIIRENKLGYVVEDSLEEMLDVLRKVYRQFHKKGSLSRLQDGQAKPFSSQVMVEKMHSLIWPR